MQSHNVDLPANYVFVDHIDIKLLTDALVFFNNFTNDTHIIESSFSGDFFALINRKCLESFLNAQPQSEEQEQALIHLKQLIEACLSIGVIVRLSK